MRNPPTHQALGTPSEATWPGVASLPSYVAFTPSAPPAGGLRPQFPASATDDCLALLAGLVTLDPQRRLTAAEAVKHKWVEGIGVVQQVVVMWAGSVGVVVGRYLCQL
jgi:hypothetical protein